MVLAWSIQHKRGITADWVGVNPILLSGQIGFEWDGTNFSKAKIGNGTDDWNTLPYFGGSGAVVSVNGTVNRISVDNTDPANPIIDIDSAYDTALAALIATALTSANNYTDSAIVNADVVALKGTIDCSGNPNYPAANAGHLYISSVAGRIGGAAGKIVEVFEFILCTVDGSLSGNEASIGANWKVIQTNITYVPEDSANKDTDGTLTANSDTKYPSQKAVKTYADTKQAALGFTPENSANKDASGGYAGLTLFKINFKNALNTFTSFFTNANTAVRTYLFQNRDGTIADDTDLALKADKASTPQLIYSAGNNPGTAVTGTTNNTLSLAIPIPAGTFASGNRMRIDLNHIKTGSNNSYDSTMYVNTSASLSGATQIAHSPSYSGAHLFASWLLNFPFKSSTQIQRFSVTFGQQSDEGQGGFSLAPVLINFNTAVLNYLIISFQNNSAADSTIVSYISVFKL